MDDCLKCNLLKQFILTLELFSKLPNPKKAGGPISTPTGFPKLHFQERGLVFDFSYDHKRHFRENFIKISQAIRSEDIKIFSVNINYFH